MPLLLTAAVFVLVDPLGDHRALYGPRILDTVLAAAVVLMPRFVVWLDSAGSRAAAQTDAAPPAVRRHRDLDPSAPLGTRQALRRVAYHR